MGDNKAPAIAGGVVLFLLTPLMIVVVLLLSSLAALGDECVPTTGGETSSFAYPTGSTHEVKAGWADLEPAHRGIDFDVPAGTAVVAAADGEVISAEGDLIKIKHGDGAETWYQYLQSIAGGIRAGTKVDRGQEIGKSGTGDEASPGAVGDHLHFELRVKDSEDGPLNPVDPTDELGDVEPPADSSCGCGGEGGPLVGSDNQEKAFNYFAANGYSPEQAAGIVGNMIHESSVEPARLQNTAPGTVTHASAAAGSASGWGIVQWTPAGKMITPALQSGASEDKVESLEFQLDFLRKQLVGEGPIPEGAAGQAVRAARTVDEAAVAFGQKFERFAGSEDLSNPRYAERKATAREVFSTYGGGVEGTAGGGCVAGNGDIVATAVALAWHSPNSHRGLDKSVATEAYQEAMPKFNGTPDNAQNPYTDCGVFVATVMRMSGADPDYPIRGTSVQEPYLRNSGKYDVFDDFTDINQLKPGDIMIGPGHTFLYIGPQEGDDGNTYAAASASWNGHVPWYTSAYINGDGKHFATARLKK